MGISTIKRINAELRKAGAPDDVRLVRNRRGGFYYYLSGCYMCPSPSLYVHTLTDSAKDYRLAAMHVNDVLKDEGITYRVPSTIEEINQRAASLAANKLAKHAGTKVKS